MKIGALLTAFFLLLLFGFLVYYVCWIKEDSVEEEDEECQSEWSFSNQVKIIYSFKFINWIRIPKPKESGLNDIKEFIILIGALY